MASIEQKNNLYFSITVTGALYFLFIFSSFWLLMDPFYFGHSGFRVARDLGPLKYIGLFFGFAFVFFAWCGLQLYGTKEQKKGLKVTLQKNILIFIFAAVIISGSLYARLYLDINESFLQMGLAVCGFFIGIFAFWLSKNPLKMVDFLIKSFLVFSIYAFCWIIYTRTQGGQAFHSEIFLIIPIFLYFLLRTDRRWLQAVLVVFIFTIGIVSFKFTAFIVLILTVVYLILLLFYKKIMLLDYIVQYLIYFFMFVCLLMLIGGIRYLFMNSDTLLPSGSVDVRMQTYVYAFANFIENPFFGIFFTGSTLVPLNDISVLGNSHVVTHSDFLDILSSGGMSLMAVFITSIALVLINVRRVFKENCINSIEKAQLHTLVLVIISGVFVSFFNAPLLTLPIGIFFWFILGLLAAYISWLKSTR